MAFVSSSIHTSSTNEAVNTAHGVSTASTQVNAANSTNIDNLSDAVICAFLASQPNSPQLVHEDLQKNHQDDMEEMDLRCNNGHVDYGRAKVECYNCHKRGHFARDCRAPRNQDNKNKEISRRSVPMQTSTFTTLVSCDGLGGHDWSDQAKKGLIIGMRSIISTISISPEGFLPFILLVVVIIVTVVNVVVMVILVVVIAAIIGVVIIVTIIGVVVVVMIIGVVVVEFHQDKASSVRASVANFTLQSSSQLLRENTDSVRSNQRMRPTAPSVYPTPLKVERFGTITLSCASRATTIYQQLVAGWQPES
ncbi:ribonuclease H-like domain-containing protein [Tanacetum coccineum]|uniref:Ribonuclease H-like domain-containing protein n=1 Tax=Tanacetum coccineum TaxID=301880 RepID=A0ABQ4YUZ6_9ASTR